MKRIIRVIALILMLSFVFDLTGASVNPTITVEAKKKKKKYPKWWEVKVGKQSVFVTSKSKKFLKYVKENPDSKYADFLYTGDDKVVYVPMCVRLVGFAEGLNHNTTIEKLVFNDIILSWSEAQYFFYDEPRDYEYYNCLYQCTALKKIKVEYLDPYTDGLHTKNGGKELYIRYRGGRNRLMWKYGERIPA